MDLVDGIALFSIFLVLINALWSFTWSCNMVDLRVLIAILTCSGISRLTDRHPKVGAGWTKTRSKGIFCPAICMELHEPCGCKSERPMLTILGPTTGVAMACSTTTQAQFASWSIFPCPKTPRPTSIQFSHHLH